MVFSVNGKMNRIGSIRNHTISEILPPMAKTPNRLRELREARGYTQADLGELCNTSSQQIGRLEKGERRLTDDWMVRIGKALNVPPYSLMDGAPTHQPSGAVPVIGEVAAGLFRESIEWPEERRFDVTMPTDERYMGLKTYGARVSGPSMNEIYPDGSIVHFVYLYDLDRNPTHGERVIVRRRNHHDGWEFTIKELRIDDEGGCWLWPRSHDPKYQEPWKLEFSEDDDAAGVPDLQIVALVIGSYRPE